MADRDKQFRMQIMMDKQGNNYKTQYNNIGGKKKTMKKQQLWSNRFTNQQ